MIGFFAAGLVVGGLLREKSVWRYWKRQDRYV
jgi:hypothetical protein